MSDLFVAFMFSSMVVTPCFLARTLFIRKDRSAILIVRSEPRVVEPSHLREAVLEPASTLIWE
jgi:hypothetical protein